MKFDFCIGNPPYQNENKGDSNTATPVYNSFMDATYTVSSRTMLITPARFLFNAGYTPKSWNEKMLNDEHLKVLDYEPNSADVFQGVDIKGGVAITYRDESKDYGAIKIFTQFEEINSVVKKIISDNSFESLSSIMVTSFAYHFTKLVYEENASLIGRSSKGHDYDIQSNTFSVFPELYSEVMPKDDDYIRILGRDGNKRCLKYIKRRYVTNVRNLDYYKVFLPKATGTGRFGETLPEAIIGYPGDGSSVTYFSIGCFENENDVNNCIKYTKTKFARLLLSVLKVTQDNTPGKWNYVPNQDFSNQSDIDWSLSIEDIDKQLYKKYKLTEAEVDFIEKNVKEME